MKRTESLDNPQRQILTYLNLVITYSLLLLRPNRFHFGCFGDSQKLWKYIRWWFRRTQKATLNWLFLIVFKIDLLNGMGSVQQNGAKSIRIHIWLNIWSINPFCWYWPFALITCVPSCDHPFTKHLDSFYKCVQHPCMRYCNGVSFVCVKPHIAKYMFIFIITRH